MNRVCDVGNERIPPSFYKSTTATLADLFGDSVFIGVLLFLGDGDNMLRPVEGTVVLLLCVSCFVVRLVGGEAMALRFGEASTSRCVAVALDSFWLFIPLVGFCNS